MNAVKIADGNNGAGLECAELADITNHSHNDVACLQFQSQSVVSQAHVGRQGGVGGFVAEFMSDVGEKGSLRSEALHPNHGLLHRGVCRVRLGRSASRISTSRPSRKGSVESGMVLKSVT